MAKYHEVTKTKDASGKPGLGNLADAVRRLAYASLGVFSVMSDEAEGFYEKCVARGEQKAQAAQAFTRGRQAARRPRAKMAGAGQPIAAMLDRSRLATKSEMDALKARVDALSHEVDGLIEQQRPR